MDLYYDYDEAVEYCANLISDDKEIIANILSLRYDYLVGCGLVLTETGEKERSKCANFFLTNNSNYIDIDLERHYCAHASGISVDRIDKILAADDCYMESVGIIQ